MLDIPSISAIVATAGVLVGVVFTYLEVRTLVKARHTDVVMGLFSTFGSQEFQAAQGNVLAMEAKNFNEVVTKGYRGSLVTVGVLFEGIGVLVQRNLVDVGLVDDLFGEAIQVIWKKVKPIVDDYRNQFNQPKWGEWFEHLYNEIVKRDRQLQQTQQ